MKKPQKLIKQPEKLTLSSDAAKKTALILRISALWIPFISSFVIFPLLEIVKANSNSTVFYEILYRLSETVTQASVFGVACILAIAIFHSDRQLLISSCAKTLIGLLFFAVALRTFMFWLLSFIDSFLAIDFSLSDYLLTTLLDENYLWWASLSYFMNVMLIVFLLALSVGISFICKKRAARKRALNNQALSNLHGTLSPLHPVTVGTVAAFVIISLISQIDNTINTIRDYGMPQTSSEFVYIFSGYFYMLIFAVVGYLTMTYLFKFILEQKKDVN